MYLSNFEVDNVINANGNWWSFQKQRKKYCFFTDKSELGETKSHSVVFIFEVCIRNDALQERRNLRSS